MEIAQHKPVSRGNSSRLNLSEERQSPRSHTAGLCHGADVPNHRQFAGVLPGSLDNHFWGPGPCLDPSPYCPCSGR